MTYLAELARTVLTALAVLLTGAHPLGECDPTRPLLERYEDAWRRWSLDGAPMRDCDADALAEVHALVTECTETE